VRDLPTGPALLALARDVLLHELMPLLPPAAHLAARLVANSMAIAEREAISGAAPAQGILHELKELYGEGGEGEQGLLDRFARGLMLRVRLGLELRTTRRGRPISESRPTSRRPAIAFLPPRRAYPHTYGCPAPRRAASGRDRLD